MKTSNKKVPTNQAGFRLFYGLGALVFFASCSAGSGASTSAELTCNGPSGAFTASTISHAVVGSATGNAMTVSVNGATQANVTSCGPGAAPNQPCVSLKICSIGSPTTCQTVNHILLDTGSYGLRIFQSALSNITTQPIVQGGSTLAECVGFGDGSSMWGSVQYAYVQMGDSGTAEPAVAMPIQLVNYGYGTPPGPCGSEQSYPALSPTQSGFNGILGVGVFKEDCGSACASDASNSQYFTCTGSNCECGATVALGAQVVNPVGMLPTDNNGVLLSLPAMNSSSGMASLPGGYLYFGIGTGGWGNNVINSNNTSVYLANGAANMLTVFSAYQAGAMSSFIDSGSNGLYFPLAAGYSGMPDCGNSNANYTGFYCPPGAYPSFMANNEGYNGSNSTAVSFSVGNAITLLSSSNMVFNNLGGNSLSSLSTYFDWGLPFFFGRPIYVGIYGKSIPTTNPVATKIGPLWAY